MKERLPAGIVMEVPEAQFRLSTDSMVLADFAAFAKNSRICDLGCGCGTLSLLLAAKDKSYQITGVEILEEPAQYAAKNVSENGLSDRVSILHADFRSSVLPSGSFDGVICNPPYYALGSGLRHAQKPLSSARSEENCTLSELAAVCGRILKFSGRAFFVYKPERMVDLFSALRENGLEPKRLQFVRHRANKPVSLILIEARRGGSSGLTVLPDCVLCNPDGSRSADYLRIYHQEVP